MRIDKSRLEAAWEKVCAALLAERNPQGHWSGELSSSALSTATASFALSLYASKHPGSSDQILPLTRRGLEWLAATQNADGGWGDTPISISNISTTPLCWAAFGGIPSGERHAGTIERAEKWLAKAAGGCDPEHLADAIIARYGKDRTFSVPILTMCALAGRLGSGRDAWKRVIPLPFELAACPHQLFAALRLPVVSYALPALIAIGQARHVNAPSTNPFARLIRNLTQRKTLEVLREIQPESGGFLEATPLTSFVLMSLVGSRQAGHAVARHAADFLMRAARPDGSWPIDTNLATWVTTLSVNALGEEVVRIPAKERELILGWLLDQQYTREHPYTHAAPGAWAWTDLPGGVPDADDTAGALLALSHLLKNDARKAEVAPSISSGLNWLMRIQNSDGGIPTFCRGWTNLPFDRSSPDITAHALRAWHAWTDEQIPNRRGEKACVRAVNYLETHQRPTGEWIPLWFGNQFDLEDENHVYGTARVLSALARFPEHAESLILRGMSRLLAMQNQDGSWCGALGDRDLPGSIEETALAIEACATILGNESVAKEIEELSEALERGVNWLLKEIEEERWKTAAPIGFYFAKLWYYERLYPIIFSVGALRAVRKVVGRAEE
jgi:squalene-hopene/tetraprenyl-beta-curcumene cyclase